MKKDKSPNYLLIIINLLLVIIYQLFQHCSLIKDCHNKQEFRLRQILTEKGLYRYVVLRENKKLTRSDGKQWTDHLKSDFKRGRGGGGGGGGEKQNKTARENAPHKKSQVKPT